MPKDRIFLKNKELIIKLEKKAGISFTKISKELYENKGYKRLKNTLIFMKNHNLKINNKSLLSIYKNEKHLRHMLMPRLETFEMKMKNIMLHEISRITNGQDLFDVRSVFKLNKYENLKMRCMCDIMRHHKIKESDFKWSKHNFFDWIYCLSMGNTFNMFNALKPKIYNEVYEKMFGKEETPKNVTHELNTIRKLRNKIAHAEQLYNNSKGQLSFKEENYFIGLKDELKKSDFKELYKDSEKHISKFIEIIDKNKK